LSIETKLVLHFKPTTLSCLNLVERCYALSNDKTIRRHVFSSVKKLELEVYGNHIKS